MDRFQNILLVLESPDIKGPAVERAVSLARTNNAKLTIANILNIPYALNHHSGLSQAREIRDALIREREGAMETLLSEFPSELDVSTMVFVGKPFLEIIKGVLRYDFDLVIKPPDTRKSLTTSIFGSTDLHLLRKCPCPVWLVKPDQASNIRQILAAVDLEPFGDDEEWNALNQQIIEMSTSLAWNESSQLHIVHTWEILGQDLLDLPWHKYLDDDVQEWMALQKNELLARKEKFSIMFQKMLQAKKMETLDYRIHMVEGETEDVVLRIAQENKVDLILMGTVSRTDLAGFFIGSTAETILGQVNRSVLAVKPAGFVSPVTLED
jgi:nucleotide-binding universal stress UspA family protein